MKVYVVVEGSENRFCGVYSTREKAMEKINDLIDNLAYDKDFVKMNKFKGNEYWVEKGLDTIDLCSLYLTEVE